MPTACEIPSRQRVPLSPASLGGSAARVGRSPGPSWDRGRGRKPRAGPSVVGRRVESRTWGPISSPTRPLAPPLANSPGFPAPDQPRALNSRSFRLSKIPCEPAAFQTVCSRGRSRPPRGPGAKGRQGGGAAASPGSCCPALEPGPCQPRAVQATPRFALFHERAATRAQCLASAPGLRGRSGNRLQKRRIRERNSRAPLTCPKSRPQQKIRGCSGA